MRRISLTIGIAALAAAVFVVACGGGPPEPAGSQGLSITFTSNPAPPKTGENRFEAMVMDQNGQPVTDANVSAEFHMAAMPQMNMPEMRNRVDLAHEGSGRYTGTGMVMMAGSWDVTVTVSRSGRVLDSEKITVTAQ